MGEVPADVGRKIPGERSLGARHPPLQPPAGAQRGVSVIPWGKSHANDDVSKTDPQTKETVRRINAEVAAEAKRRVVQDSRASEHDGKGKR